MLGSFLLLRNANAFLITIKLSGLRVTGDIRNSVHIAELHLVFQAAAQ